MNIASSALDWATSLAEHSGVLGDAAPTGSFGFVPSQRPGRSVRSPSAKTKPLEASERGSGKRRWSRASMGSFPKWRRRKSGMEASTHLYDCSDERAGESSWDFGIDDVPSYILDSSQDILHEEPEEYTSEDLERPDDTFEPSVTTSRSRKPLLVIPQESYSASSPFVRASSSDVGPPHDLMLLLIDELNAALHPRPEARAVRDVAEAFGSMYIPGIGLEITQLALSSTHVATMLGTRVHVQRRIREILAFWNEVLRPMGFEVGLLRTADLEALLRSRDECLPATSPLETFTGDNVALAEQAEAREREAKSRRKAKRNAVRKQRLDKGIKTLVNMVDGQEDGYDSDDDPVKMVSQIVTDALGLSFWSRFLNRDDDSGDSEAHAQLPNGADRVHHLATPVAVLDTVSPAINIGRTDPLAKWANNASLKERYKAEQRAARRLVLGKPRAYDKLLAKSIWLVVRSVEV